MKRKILALLLVVIMMFSMTSCFAGKRPELDLITAKDNLIERDYMVSIEDDTDFLDLGAEEEFEAFSTENDDSINITKYKNAKYAKIIFKILKQENKETIKSLKLEIRQTKYLIRKYKKTLDQIKIENLNDDLEDLLEELEERQDNYIVGRKGRYVWYGTPGAINDTKSED